MDIEVAIDLVMADLLQVTVISRHHPVVFFHEYIVLGRIIQGLLRDPAHEHLRFMPAFVPKLDIQAVKQAAHIPIPAVQQVIGKLA